MKFQYYFLTLIFCSVLLFSCNTTAEKNMDSIVQKWEMSKFEIDQTDQTQRFNPNRDVWLEFKDDGTYYTEGGPFPPESGTYSFDGSELTMDSNIANAESIFWNVSIIGNKMVFSRISNQNKLTEIHYQVVQ